MKKRIAILFSTVLFCICTMLGMVGCDADGYNEYNEDYPVTVTYYFNEGRINSYPNEKYLNLHYQANAYIVAPGAVTSFAAVQRPGYFIDGWYYAKRDAQGNVMKDENGYVLSSGEAFDFSKRVNQNIALVPGWTHKVSVLFRNCESIKQEVDGETVYQEHSIVVSDEGNLKKPSFEKTKRGAWIKGYAWDEGLTEPIVFGKDGLSVYDLLARTDESCPTDKDGNLVLTVYTRLYGVEAKFIDTITGETYPIRVGAGEKLTVPTEEEFFRGKSEFYLSYKAGQFSDAIDLTDGADFYELTDKLSARPTLSADKESMVLEIYVK